MRAMTPDTASATRMDLKRDFASESGSDMMWTLSERILWGCPQGSARGIACGRGFDRASQNVTP
ncbi:hypothetical protein GCM10010458_05370 [Microbacterium luteolum]